MKYIAAIICLLLTTVTAPALAHEVNTCADQAEKVKINDRDEFLKSCLAKLATPENVAKSEKHDKQQHCDTNAKNMKLDGKKKTEYLDHCYHENDFDPKNKPHPKM
jgi:hypothetical protein